MNSFQAVGRLTRDPELRQIGSNNTSVCDFSIAENYYAGSKGEQTNFHDCVAWGKLAETIGEHCQKGKQVFVIGRLETDNWEAEDGSKRSKKRVNVRDFSFVGSKGDSNSGDKSDDGGVVSTDDEVPFG